MARTPERYADRCAGRDLRAYLEHRVVRAHETGAWAETRSGCSATSPGGLLAGAVFLLS